MTDSKIGDTAASVMPRREAQVEIAEFDDATVVFDDRTNTVHLLEAFAAVVFDACDGSTVRSALAEEISDALGQPCATVAEQVDATIANFAGLGLLDGVEPAAQPPCIGCSGSSTSADGSRIRGRIRRRGLAAVSAEATGRRSRG